MEPISSRVKVDLSLAQATHWRKLLTKMLREQPSDELAELLGAVADAESCPEKADGQLFWRATVPSGECVKLAELVDFLVLGDRSGVLGHGEIPLWVFQHDPVRPAIPIPFPVLSVMLDTEKKRIGLYIADKPG